MADPISLIERGYKIFPCAPDKKPLTPHGYKDASSDHNQITNWQRQYPACLWGIPAQDNGFFALDIDPDGFDYWKHLTKDNPPFEYGPCQRTPRGGWHYLFALPIFPVPNNSGKVGKGLDLRSAGYIATGKGYSWEQGHGIDQPILPAPAWLLDMIKAIKPADNVNMRIATTPATDPTEAGEYWLNWALDQARPGNRNETGFNLALQLRDSGLTKSQAETIMQQYAARVPGKDYSEWEALNSLREAYSAPARQPAALPGSRREAIMTDENEQTYTLNIQNQPMIYDGSKLESHPCTDTRNGERFVSQHGDRVRWVAKAGRWYCWDGTRWAKDETGEAERLAKITAKSIYLEANAEKDEKMSKALASWAITSQSTAAIERMLISAKSEIGITVPFNVFDQDHYKINFLNGTLDLRTGTLYPHNPQDFITKLIPLEYDDKATCPRWMQFLDEIMDHKPHLIKYLQRAVGYSLTGDTGEQKFFTCWGKGANGKSVFLETILNAFGTDYGSNAEAKTILLRDRSGGASNDIASLRGQRVVTVNEIPGRGRLDEAKIKELTGGDTVTCRFLYQEPFSYKPAYKIWIRTNHKPVITGVDYGIWRRVQLIPFTITIPPEKQDTKLQEKLHEEWQGILTWAVMGCLAWQDEGLQPPEEVKAATAEYKREQDTMQPFIDEVCRKDDNIQIKSSELYTAYKTWADANGEKPMTSTAFGRELSERGYEGKHTAAGKIYFGIGIK